MILNNYVGEFDGFKLIETDVITKEVQVRKHKKKRINKKWAKRYGFKKIPDYERIVVANGCIFAQPRVIERIISEVNSRGWNLDDVK